MRPRVGGDLDPSRQIVVLRQPRPDGRRGDRGAKEKALDSCELGLVVRLVCLKHLYSL